MYKRWVKRESAETWAPLDPDGRILLSAETGARGPGEVVGEFRIDGNGAAIIVPAKAGRTADIQGEGSVNRPRRAVTPDDRNHADGGTLRTP